jgi:xylan 1,4-beta-xylosidase
MFVGERCFEGTRTFSTQGIDKAILNLFRMYGKTGENLLAFESDGAKDPLSYADDNGMGEDADISGFASADGESVSVLVYHHHDDWDLSENATVNLEIANLAFDDEVRIEHYRIDGTHSNAYPEWLEQGKPMYPSIEQRESIKAREGLELLHEPETQTVENGAIQLKFSMPTHSISLLVVKKT